jgi:flagellum-specific ATP synthase
MEPMDPTKNVAPAPKSMVPMRRFQRQDLLKSMTAPTWQVNGRICNVVGNVVEAYMPGSRIGALVNINPPGGGERVLAEVVGVKEEKALLLPFGSLSGISTGCVVSGERQLDRVAVSESLLGKVVDPFLQPIDGQIIAMPERCPMVPIERAAPNPMTRKRITRRLSLGIRALDGLLTLGDGQRLGIMAGSGVGKSVLMGMIARGSEADVNVIGLIGERGREVREFIERDLGPQGLARSVVVVATGDQSPIMRIRAAKVTTAIAEYFSSQGARVLMMMDSLTRVAMARREIGISVGEPPTTKAYPPSVFSLLPQLLERTGPQMEGHGNITSLYTVLVDGDDLTDPIADAARSILDGHINLSRAMANRGHFPAIEVTSSASRVMYDIVAKDHWAMAARIKGLLGTYQENIDLVQTGTYVAGRNAVLDEALALMPAIERYLRQEIDERSTFDEALTGLASLIGMGRQNAAGQRPKVG